MSSSQVSEPQISYLESSLIKNCSAVSTMDQMGIAEPVKDHWSHVVPFDFCPAIDCLARETTLVAAHTAPAIHMLFHLDEYFQPAYRLSCSVPSARLTVRPHISNAPLILFFLSLSLRAALLASSKTPRRPSRSHRSCSFEFAFRVRGALHLTSFVFLTHTHI